MIILNQDCTRCNQPIDLAECYPVDSNRYISVQQIDDGYTTYTICDQTANTVLQPDKWHNQYSLKDIDGNTFYLSSKQIVRALYDSEWCVDTIPDLPGEEWCFVGRYFLGDKHHESFLVSNWSRIKSYTDNNAFLMHPYANCQTGYMEIKFGDTNRERPSLHRLVGYHFCWKKDCPDLPFESLDIHHIASIHENQAWNLSAMPKAEHIKLHQRLNKAGIVGLKEPLAI